jgi:polysaccharide export outer membrane protein
MHQGEAFLHVTHRHAAGDGLAEYDRNRDAGRCGFQLISSAMTAIKELLRKSLHLFAVLLLPFVAAAADATAAPDYPIGAGDLVRISVFNHPELTADVRVSQSGTITFPLIGEIKATGLPPHDLEKALATRLNDGGYVPHPQVSVLITDYQSQRFSVLGQVTRPGQYPMMTEVTVINALAAAGGVVNLVAADEATLLRRDGTRVQIDLISLFQGDPRQNPSLGAGETLYVPRAAQFYIYGAVQRPGNYRLERGMTVSQAISTGGGLTPRGSERHVIVTRRDYPGGKARQISVDGQDLIQPDDVLRVKESLF